MSYKIWKPKTYYWKYFLKMGITLSLFMPIFDSILYKTLPYLPSQVQSWLDRFILYPFHWGRLGPFFVLSAIFFLIYYRNKFSQDDINQQQIQKLRVLHEEDELIFEVCAEPIEWEQLRKQLSETKLTERKFTYTFLDHWQQGKLHLHIQNRQLSHSFLEIDEQGELTISMNFEYINKLEEAISAVSEELGPIDLKSCVDRQRIRFTPVNIDEENGIIKVRYLPSFWLISIVPALLSCILGFGIYGLLVVLSWFA